MTAMRRSICILSSVLNRNGATSLASSQHTHIQYISPLASQRRFISFSEYRLGRNFYDVLGVSKTASSKDIKSAYMKLAKKYHPDVSKEKDASKKFQEVSEAYEVLSDSDQKQQYDATGTTGSHPGAGGFGQSAGFNRQQTMDPEELFRHVFGNFGGGGGFGGSRGGGGFTAGSPFGQEEDAGVQQVAVNLSFREAARGVHKQVNIQTIEACGTCTGTGAAKGSKPITCTTCAGTGFETVNTGPFVMRSSCRQCGGQRKIISDPCKSCGGSGKSRQRKTVSIPIPAGVEDGQTLRIQVAGRDVYVSLQVAASREFKRDGADVHSNLKLSLAQAALGGTQRVQGVFEDILVNIPASSSSGAKLRLAGKGLPRLQSSGHGDHYLHFQIVTEKKLTLLQRELLERYAETEADTEGSINGLTRTTSGFKRLSSHDTKGKAETQSEDDLSKGVEASAAAAATNNDDSAEPVPPKSAAAN